MVTINLDGFSLANRRRFAKFAKLSPRQTFPLYGILGNVVSILPLAHCIGSKEKYVGNKANDEIYCQSQNTMV